jgi:hypothetical protein
MQSYALPELGQISAQPTLVADPEMLETLNLVGRIAWVRRGYLVPVILHCDPAERELNRCILLAGLISV